MADSGSMVAGRGGILPVIPLIKFVLIAGVIFIHSNLATHAGGQLSAGLMAVDAVSRIFSLFCVPCFFIISGFLFFRNVGRECFFPGGYVAKLKGRLHSLLIPYIFWNLFCLALFVAKHYLLGYSGLGIIVDGKPDVAAMLRGFLYIPDNEGMPYAYAFWFIRDLMAIVLLSPVLFAIGRRWWLSALFIVCAISIPVKTHGVEWFVTGAALSLHGVELERFRLRPVMLACVTLLFVALSLLLAGGRLPEWMFAPVHFIQVGAAFVVVYNFCECGGRFMRSGAGKSLIGSTFFMFAFHECFSSAAGRFWLKLSGTADCIAVFAAYVATAVTLAVVSYAVYLLLKRLSPRCLDLITGHRS